MHTSPIRIAVSGAAGGIAYALAFRIAAGDMFGPDQPVILQMLDAPPAMRALAGVAMELGDCATPLLDDLLITDDPLVAFRDADWALLIGARRPDQGMQRLHLVRANAEAVRALGRALNEGAARDLRVVVVSDTANSDCLVAMRSAPAIPPERFTALTRLEHHRAQSLLAARAGVPLSEVRKVSIWGNRSDTLYPDAYHAEIAGRSALEVIGDDAWIVDTFMPRVVRRDGTAVPECGSTAEAIIRHVQSWRDGTPADDWVSMGIPSTGEYGAPEGVVFSYPVMVSGGVIRVVDGLPLSDLDRERLALTAAELLAERDAVEGLL